MNLTLSFPSMRQRKARQKPPCPLPMKLRPKSKTPPLHLLRPQRLSLSKLCQNQPRTLSIPNITPMAIPSLAMMMGYICQAVAAESPFPTKSYRHLADIFPAILLSASPSPIPPRPIWKALSCPLPTTIRPASATPAYSSLPLLQAIPPKFPCLWRSLPVRSLYPWSSTSLAPAHNGYSPRKCSSYLTRNK